MNILLYVTDIPSRVISGGALALNLPNNTQRQEMLDVIAETIGAGVIQLENGDHLLVGK